MFELVVNVDMKPLSVLGPTGLTVILSMASAAAQLIYEGPLGFYDPIHTRDNGLQYSQVTGVAGNYFSGASTRYDGASSARGATAWIARADGTTTRVGLYGGIYGSSYQLSTVMHVNADGVSAGTSGFYTGFSGFGTATWIATGDGATAQTGLTSALYTLSLIHI